MKTSAVPIYTESAQALSSDLNPVILLINLETHETTLPKKDPFKVNWAYYRRLLKQAIPGNPNNVSRRNIRCNNHIYFNDNQKKSVKTISYIPISRGLGHP
jgi:hypothetical protein